MQMVYQDPLAALDRRIAVGRQVMEPLAIHAIGTRGRAARQGAGDPAGGRACRRITSTAIRTSCRAASASAIVLAARADPRRRGCWSATSRSPALDVSIQAQVVNLLLDLQAQMGLAYLFISHDLRMVRQVSHEVAVMYLGRIVERGDPDRLFAAPAHPYTQALVSAIPVATQRRAQRLIAAGRAAQPGRRADGLRLPCALPDRRRAMPRRNAGAACRWRTGGTSPAISRRALTRKTQR